MQRRLLVLAGLTLPCLLAAQPAKADCDNPFAKPNELLDFHIRMKKADWEKLRDVDKIRNIDTVGGPMGSKMVDDEICKDKFPKYHAEFRCGTTGEWIKIGVRKKKGTERGVEAPNKPPLKLDFNEDFPDDNPQNEAKGQRWPKAMGENGFRKLTLNNGMGNKAPDVDMLPPFMNPILLSEYTALRLLNKEIPSAPQAAYAKVTLHLDGDEGGEYHGVYLVAEDIDRTAIKKRFGDATGRLIKASTPDCSPEVQYDDFGDKPNQAKEKFTEWVTKNPADFGNWLEETKKLVDIDVLFRQEAIREILVNGNDTIFNSRAWLEWEKWGEGNNWVAFDPEKGVRQYMPWDVDLTFGNQRGACTTPTPSTNPMMVTNMDGTTSLAPAVQNRFACPYDMPLLDWCKEMPQVVGPKSYSRLAKQVCANEDAKKRYLEVMCQLTNGPLSADEILKIWDQADATIHRDVMAEADINWMGRNPLDEGVRKSYGAEYRRLREWIPKRIKSVQEQITKLGVQCKAGCQDGAKDSCTYNGGEGERVCNANKWTACRKVGGDMAKADESKMGCSYGEGRGGGAAAAFGSLFALAALIARKRRKN